MMAGKNITSWNSYLAAVPRHSGYLAAVPRQTSYMAAVLAENRCFVIESS
jgi:hypothetical protein